MRDIIAVRMPAERRLFTNRERSPSSGDASLPTAQQVLSRVRWDICGGSHPPAPAVVGGDHDGGGGGGGGGVRCLPCARGKPRGRGGDGGETAGARDAVLQLDDFTVLLEGEELLGGGSGTGNTELDRRRRLCRSWVRKGVCDYGCFCKYNHTLAPLRLHEDAALYPGDLSECRHRRRGRGVSGELFDAGDNGGDDEEGDDEEDEGDEEDQEDEGGVAAVVSPRAIPRRLRLKSHRSQSGGMPSLRPAPISHALIDRAAVHRARV